MLGQGEYAIFLFGSLCKGTDFSRGKNGTSDVDLLVVVNDGVPEERMKRAYKALNALEMAVFHDRERKGIVQSVLHVIERQTGMHENIFMTRHGDAMRVDFTSMFRTNKVISKLIAPTNIVMGSAMSCIAFLHGNPSLSPVKEVLRRIGQEKHLYPDLIKSLVMNIVLSLGACVILPLSAKATKYAVESVKWSMYAVSYTLTKKRPSKRAQQRFFVRAGIPSGFMTRWFSLSQHVSRDPLFTLEALWQVLRIHALGFRTRKMKK